MNEQSNSVSRGTPTDIFYADQVSVNDVGEKTLK